MWGGKVVLSEEDRHRAAECARKRISDARKVNAQDRFGKDDLWAHFHGALGELAFARFMGVPWECESMVWATEDVGKYEVRAIPPKQQHVYLKAKKNDPDDRKIVLVLLLANYADAMIVGWATAKTIRDNTTKSDWGNRGASAHMLTDFRHLSYDFPERVGDATG